MEALLQAQHAVHPDEASLDRYSVLIVDLFHYGGGDDCTVSGFPIRELARKYARRRVRDSLEELREPGMTHAELRSRWMTFGEDVVVLDDDLNRPGFAGGSRAQRGATKTGEAGRYPVGRELAEWIERNVPTEARFEPETPLFANPRTGRPYAHWTLDKLWRRACDDAEVSYVPIYRALKHSTLSELARELPLEQLQALARHRSVETTRGYLGEVADPKGAAIEARERLVAEHQTDRRVRDLRQPANSGKPATPRRS